MQTTFLKKFMKQKDSPYSTPEIDKLLEKVIFLFFSYTLQLCDNIYATHKIKSEIHEKPNRRQKSQIL